MGYGYMQYYVNGINTKRNNDYGCKQMVIVEMAKFLNADYQMISLGNWRFDYNHNSDISIGEKLIQIYPSDYEKHIYEFHGLRTTHITSSTCKMKKIVFERLQRNLPTIVHSDVYWCPWYSAFKRIHYSHYYLIVGFNEESNDLICYDPILCDQHVYSNIDILFMGIDKLITVELQECHLQPKLTHYLKTLYEDARELRENMNYANNMMDFANDIQFCFDRKKEFDTCRNDYDQAAITPLIDNLRDIFVYRIGYANMIDYVCNMICAPCQAELRNDMDSCISMWKMIRFKFIRMALGRQKDLEVNEMVAYDILRLSKAELELSDKIVYNIGKYI